MGIAKEFADTLQAKVLAVIRSLQDPKQQVELAIKQLEDLLNDSVNKAAEAAGEAGLIRQKYLWEQKQADDDANSARLAMAKAKDLHAKGDEKNATEYEDAARQALQMKLQHQDIADQYHQQADSLDEQVAKLRDEIAKLRLLIQKLKARKAAVAATEAQTAAVRKIGQVAQGAADLDDILNTFERMEDKATLQLKTAQAKVEMAKDPVAEKLAKLTYDARVDEEFEKLKQQS
jgi:phage shock protein A